MPQPALAARHAPALHPDASLFAALTAQPRDAATTTQPWDAAGGPAPIELVQALSAATRGFGMALARAGEDMDDLDGALPPRLRHRLRGVLLRLEDAAARQQHAAAALALHLARTMR